MLLLPAWKALATMGSENYRFFFPFVKFPLISTIDSANIAAFSCSQPPCVITSKSPDLGSGT